MKKAAVFIFIVMPAVLMAAPVDIVKVLKSGTYGQVLRALKGKDMNKPVADTGGRTPLELASRWNRDVKVIDALIANGADIEGTGAIDIGTPLLEAATYNPNPEVVEHLIRAGADIKARFGHGPENDTLVALAVHNNNVSVLKTVIEAKAAVNAKFQFGFTLMTPLHFAVANPPQLAYTQKHNLEVIRTLLAAGASLEEVASDSLTPLHYAAMYRTPEVVSLLLAAGANVNARGDGGATPLMIAAGANPDPQVITTLLQAGADATLADENGGTAADMAEFNQSVRGTPQHQELKRLAALARPKGILDSAKSGTLDEVKAAIARGEKVDAKEQGTNMTPLQLAAEGNADPAVITALIRGGAKADQRNETTNATPLMYAVSKNRSQKVAEALLAAGASANAVDSLGQTPLMYAVRVEGNLEIIGVLLRAGGKVDSADLMGTTALMIAASTDRTADNVRALLKAGANPHAKDLVGKTALDAAKKNFEGTMEYEKVLEMLK